MHYTFHRPPFRCRFSADICLPCLVQMLRVWLHRFPPKPRDVHTLLASFCMSCFQTAWELGWTLRSWFLLVNLVLTVLPVTVTSIKDYNLTYCPWYTVGPGAKIYFLDCKNYNQWPPFSSPTSVHSYFALQYIHIFHLSTFIFPTSVHSYFPLQYIHV